MEDDSGDDEDGTDGEGGEDGEDGNAMDVMGAAGKIAVSQQGDLAATEQMRLFDLAVGSPGSAALATCCCHVYRCTRPTNWAGHSHLPVSTLCALTAAHTVWTSYSHPPVSTLCPLTAAHTIWTGHSHPPISTLCPLTAAHTIWTGHSHPLYEDVGHSPVLTATRPS